MRTTCLTSLAGVDARIDLAWAADHTDKLTTEVSDLRRTVACVPPTPTAVTGLIADVLAGLPNSTVTVSDAGTVIATLTDGSAFFVTIR